jgi:hypothetical protein
MAKTMCGSYPHAMARLTAGVCKAFDTGGDASKRSQRGNLTFSRLSNSRLLRTRRSEPSASIERRSNRFSGSNSLGWDLTRFPKEFYLFELHSEISRISADEDELQDLAFLTRGYSEIFQRNGKIHSQLGQEAFVVGITNGAHGLKYLELGAYDPYLLSNTATLRDSFQWTGLSVDPNPAVLDKFKLAQLEDSFLGAGVAGVAGDDSKEILIRNGAMSQTQRTTGRESSKDEEVSLIGIKEIVSNLASVDYLSIDIEGGEPEVLVEFPFERVKPLVITVEHNFRDADKLFMQSFLSKIGYRQFLPNRTDFESWFVLNKDAKTH